MNVKKSSRTPHIQYKSFSTKYGFTFTHNGFWQFLGNTQISYIKMKPNRRKRKWQTKKRKISMRIDLRTWKWNMVFRKMRAINRFLLLFAFIYRKSIECNYGCNRINRFYWFAPNIPIHFNMLPIFGNS